MKREPNRSQNEWPGIPRLQWWEGRQTFRMSFRQEAPLSACAPTIRRSCSRKSVEISPARTLLWHRVLEQPIDDQPVQL
jgi:hypothetical protein